MNVILPIYIWPIFPLLMQGAPLSPPPGGGGARRAASPAAPSRGLSGEVAARLIEGELRGKMAGREREVRVHAASFVSFASEVGATQDGGGAQGPLPGILTINDVHTFGVSQRSFEKADQRIKN